ncbi:MAG: PEP-CTERM sorting domain-containing protein [Vicinamibacteraceae bacterium]
MRFTTTLAAGSLALTALITAPAQAAPILGTAGTGLQNAGIPMENSVRYWDGNSWDSDGMHDGAGFSPCSAGSMANGIPCHLNASADEVAVRAGLPGTTFTLAEGGIGYQAWGQNNGNADLNYGFDGGQGGLYDFSMLGEFTDDWDVNEIGWYDLGNPQSRHTIFSASAVVGSTARVWIPSNFGFYYLNTSGNGEIFYTQSAFNTLGATKQQFAAFQRGDYTIMGVEDIFSNTLTRGWQAGTADYDYNDVMFGYRSAAVPEPGTLLLLGMGVAAIALRRRKTA